ncbi:hypothetical protein BRADI_1g05290v3 [Brachypodium distachyon]|uniref:Uncharacterized protein n=1 Tax=Brachypodium distachyon TaxID=15368 RepID=A0A0Q3KNI2_BRADI|nr:hypothetical protein BRADI_1g05290v3 [Brachypodium distachyon]
MGKYAEMLDMAARVAVRSYTHCPHTARVYYKPPQTPTTTAAAASSASCGAREKAGAEESSKTQQQPQQAAAAVRAVFDATEIILNGGV